MEPADSFVYSEKMQNAAHTASADRPILLVEDSQDDYEATVRAFQKAGLVNPLQHAPTGEKALDCLYAERPCLILLDLNMPGMGGRRFLERVKGEDAYRDIPVVVLSTSNDMEDIRACYANGANAYIIKSADFNALANDIRRLKEYWLDTVAHSVPRDESGADAAEKEKGRLAPWEIETLVWISRGKSRWETGVILGVSEDTVKSRLEKCRQKLGASNTTHAIAIALQQGLLN